MVKKNNNNQEFKSRIDLEKAQIDEVLKELNVDSKMGLSSSEAQNRLKAVKMYL